MIMILHNTWTASFYYLCLYLACFVVSTFVIFIWVCWILMAYAISATYLFRRLQKTFSSCDHMQVDIYDGGQIELFHIK